MRHAHAHAGAATAPAEEHAYPLQPKEGKVQYLLVFLRPAGHCFKNPVTEQQGMRCYLRIAYLHVTVLIHFGCKVVSPFFLGTVKPKQTGLLLNLNKLVCQSQKKKSVYC